MASRELDLQISLICGFFMMYCHMVMEVIQKAAPEMAMVMSPGTHPKTLKKHCVNIA